MDILLLFDIEDQTLEEKSWNTYETIVYYRALLGWLDFFPFFSTKYLKDYTQYQVGWG